jgi:hypothetical protein
MAGAKHRARADELLIILTPLYVTLLSALLLFSCGAGSSAREITVQVPDTFAGTLRISPCDRSQSERVAVDERGVTATSVCPRSGEQVTLVVIRSGQTYRISPENVTIRRAGDGLPVSIEATIPPR